MSNYILALPKAWQQLPLGPHDDGNSAAFQNEPLRVVISFDENHAPEGRWRHVSVSCQDRLPTYAELGEVRELFFNPEATVVQIMPPKSQWVNQHQFCLHLWQRLDKPLLPQGLHGTVGVRNTLPLDELEAMLLRADRDLEAHVRNVVRSRGQMTVREIAEALPQTQRRLGAARREVQAALDWLCPRCPQLGTSTDGKTWRWRPS